MTTTYDTIRAAVAEMRTANLRSWARDPDTEIHAAFYRERWGVEQSDIDLFLDLRSSPVLRTAFADKYHEQPALGRFDDFANQIADVIDPYSDFETSSLEARVNAVIAEFFPHGTTATAPRYDPDLECTFVALTHPALPDSCGCVFLGGDEDSDDRVREAIWHGVDEWWDELVADLGSRPTNTEGNPDSGILGYWFAAELAKTYASLSDALPRNLVEARRR